MKINAESPKENGELSYAEIKEKIIHRTVTYVPDYSEIVHTVISEMKYEDDTYKKFVEKCEGGLLEVFAPEREDNERPHNIRSFKCAIKDFYRVYNTLREKEFDNLDKWFYSFTAYVIAAKANIAKEGAYGSFISDRYVKNLYPAFQEPYMISGIKNWIFNGTWDEEWIFFELERLKEQEKAKTPEDIVRTYRIIDVDEEVINTGFPNVLNMAYHGTLTLDEYVLFIENSYWARCYGFTFPISVEWDKVKKGIKHAIQLLIDSRQEGQSHHSIITDSNKQYFTEAEWDTYLIIEKFRDKNVLMFSNNKALYIEQMQEDAFSAFSICQNKRFDEFNEKMAVATAEAYAKMGNSDKHQFSGYFKKMWKSNIMSQDLKTEDTLVGFNILRDMLLEQKKHLAQENKVFAVCHTNDFIQYLDELVEKIKESATSVTQM